MNRIVDFQQSNFYYQANTELFLKLMNILRTIRRATTKIENDKELLNWINSIVIKLQNKEYSLQTKIYWILNGLTDFPKCNTCGKLLEHKNVHRIFNPQYSFCDFKCTINNQLVKDKIKNSLNLNKLNDTQYQEKVNAKRRQTCLEKYGVEYISQSKDIQEKQKQTCLEKYGVDRPLKSKEIKEKVKQTCLEKYGVENVFKSLTIIKKIKDTIQHKIDINPNYRNEILLKSRNTKIKRYGNANYCNIEKQKQTIIQKYGEGKQTIIEKAKQTREQKLKENPNYWKDIQLKRIQTCIKRYNVESTNSLESVKLKKEQTCLKHFGVKSQNQASEIRKKQIAHYFYDKKYFDSKPELALYIWLIDNKIKFEYQPNVELFYEYNGLKHRYFPDFKIANVLYELKGNHMLDKISDKWICPWDRSKDDLYEAKHQCVLANNVKILYLEDY